MKIKYLSKIDQALVDPEQYKYVIEKLIHKNSNHKKNMRKSPLIEGLSLEWIAKNTESLINIIIESIQKNDFQFSVQKKIAINTGEKTRDIYISNYADKILLMHIQNLIAQEVDPFLHEHLFSFRKKKGPKAASLALSKYIKSNKEAETLYFIGRDITAYGENINPRKLFEQISTSPPLKDSSLLLSLVHKALRCEYYHESKEILFSLWKGIPSGSPLVPIFENIHLSELDQILGEINNSFYARYGDDFIFLTTSRDKAIQAQQIIKLSTKRLGLNVSEKKSKNLQVGKKNPDNEFIHANFFEWIGISFYKNGMYSFRPKHKKENKTRYRHEIGNFTYFIANSGIEQDIKGQCLELAFNESQDFKLNSSIQKLIVLRTHIQNTKNEDIANRKFMIRCLCKTHKIKKKEAWKMLRKMKLSSIENQRRKLKCNKTA